ncbi:hypothetical protein GCM10027063_34040 [Promicromonospora xylanilytica]
MLSMKRSLWGAGLVMILAGCSGTGGEEVASLDSETASVNGYVNQATADYADCLESAGFSVAPEDDAAATVLQGYARIDGGTFIPDQDGALTDDTARQPIGVGGEDRSEEIRGCYADHAGAKDALIDMHDEPAPVDQVERIPESEVEAGRQWAQCARDAGVSLIEDPNEEGYVVIPEDLELKQAEFLGAKCSEPMAEYENWPQFEILAGVMDPESGMRMSDPFAIALDGPFLNSDKAQAYREEHPEEFADE